MTDIKVESKFIGYTEQESDSQLLVIVKGESLLNEVAEGEAQMIFDQTPFYAEMGGQVADQGWIMNEVGEIVAVVTDVQKRLMVNLCTP